MKNIDSELHWAGCIQLLCKCYGQVDEETKGCIDNAVTMWCRKTGWTIESTTGGIDIFPPAITE